LGVEIAAHFDYLLKLGLSEFSYILTYLNHYMNARFLLQREHITKV